MKLGKGSILRCLPFPSAETNRALWLLFSIAVPSHVGKS
ncbi:hypothetical protein DSOL_5397 [Desulfosporosinus metallidurans]|uniref:Uncharacterized protein n=1 Tax=Desulfosporosinus metallidurans TaxID=1888891 RepID=A0A1Q8QC14_9FIRM|nr:hypothetical protein DSOL_5397 [Desulfosporosinus metallidurans]